jgi:SOS-response transcriptional repressor LexA
MNLAINSITTQEVMVLAENLNKFMLERKVDSKILHQATGISISAINSLRRGEGNPTLTTLLELAKFFNCSIDALVGLNKGNNLNNKNSPKTIPVYSLNDSVQRLKEAIIECIAEDCSSHHEHDLFAIKIHNNVYAPFFEKGSYFIVSKTLKYSDGDIVLVNINDNVIIRKIFTTNTGQVKFYSIAIQPEVNQYDAFDLVGVVIKVIQPLY